MYANGKGVVQDHKQAVRWYLKAAEQGNAAAQANLGYMYSHGKGVIQNNRKAYIWSSRAASNGHKDAVFNRELIAKRLSPSALDEAQKEVAKPLEKSNKNSSPLLFVFSVIILSLLFYINLKIKRKSKTLTYEELSVDQGLQTNDSIKNIESQPIKEPSIAQEFFYLFCCF